MKLRILLLSFIVMVGTTSLSAQSVEEIIDTYFENTGGADKWKALNGMVSRATVNNQGMDIPVTIISLKDGRSMFKFQLQGKEIVQQAFDGTDVWGTNFMTMEAEKSDNETTENTKRQSKEFPDPFLNYKELGYKVELMGKEDAEGVECFKIKLTKDTQLVDGQEVDNISYYYFDTENYVPIVVESDIKTGQMKGNVSRATFSDYQEVDGLYFPFSISQGIKDMGEPQVINFTAIELNPEVDAAMFKMPASIAADKEDGGK